MELRESHLTHLLYGWSSLDHEVILVYELCVLDCWREAWGMQARVKEWERETTFHFLCTLPVDGSCPLPGTVSDLT